MVEMVGESWLLEMAFAGRLKRDVAFVILEMQIKTARNRGHVVYTNSEHVRRAILQSAHHGWIATVAVPCQRCGWSATLSQWCNARNLGKAECLRQAATMRARNKELDVHYLMQCDPGTLPQDTLDVIAPGGE